MAAANLAISPDDVTTPSVPDAAQQDPLLARVQARAQQNSQSTGQPAKPAWVPSPDDPLHHIQVGDQHLHIHADDLAEAKRRDPNLIDHGPSVSNDDPMLARVQARKTQKDAGVSAAAVRPGAYQQTKGGAIRNVSEDVANPFSETTTSVIGKTGALMKRPDETDSQFMSRAIQAGKNVTQAQIDAETASNKKLAAPTLGVAAAAGPAMLAPVAAVDEALTKLGIGAAEDMGLREWVEQMGLKIPGAKEKVIEILQHPLVREAIKKVGMKILGGAIGGGGMALGWKAIHELFGE